MRLERVWRMGLSSVSLLIELPGERGGDIPMVIAELTRWASRYIFRAACYTHAA